MTFDLILAFDRDTGDFSHGFEAGRTWELLKDGVENIEGQLIHAENAEIVIRMAEALDLTIAAEFTSDDRWMRLSSKVGEGRA